MGAAVKPIRGKPAKQRPHSKRQVSSPLDRAKAWEMDWQQVSELFAAARRFNNCLFVYFIGEEAEGAVKIGVAKDPIVRLRSMQTGNPRRLRLERLLVGDMALEKLLHEMWKEFAIEAVANRNKVDVASGTEWFRAGIREPLFPVVETAATRQVEHLREARGDVTPHEMESIVRGAHGSHGIVAHRPHEVRLLARGPGYVNPGRRSRI